MLKLFIAAILGMLLLGGCGYKEGVANADRKAYLYFTGSVKDVSVSVDGGEAFSIEEGRDNLYTIAPGKHRVVVKRGDRVVVEREIYVGNGVSKEIAVGGK